jgi:hypothetical protein
MHQIEKKRRKKKEEVSRPPHLQERKACSVVTKPISVRKTGPGSTSLFEFVPKG